MLNIDKRRKLVIGRKAGLQSSCADRTDSKLQGLNDRHTTGKVHTEAQ